MVVTVVVPVATRRKTDGDRGEEQTVWHDGGLDRWQALVDLSVTKMETSLVTSIHLVLVCILTCSTLGKCRYEAVDVNLDEFDLYTISSYDPLHNSFF
jgi:hypothetical protein